MVEYPSDLEKGRMEPCSMRKTLHEQDVQEAIEWARTVHDEGIIAAHILERCKQPDYMKGVLAAAHEQVATDGAARKVVEIARNNQLQTDDDAREYMRIRASGKLFRARLVRYDQRQKYRQAGVLK